MKRFVPAHELVGKGSPVALVPGTFSDRRTWRNVVGAMSARFTCLLFDPRGTGASPDPGTRFGPDDLVADLLAVLDAAGLERTHLVGHSLGATVSLIAAARHPTRVGRVAVIGPALAPDPYIEAVLDHWEALGRSDLAAHDLHRGLVIPAFGRDAFRHLVPAVVEDMDRHPLARETVLRYVACDRLQDLRPHLGRVDAPVLVLAGADDALTGPGQARAVAEAIPGSRLQLLGGCGHSPQLERPQEVARLIADFLG